MKDIAPNSSPEPTSSETDKQPTPFFLAVGLTALLYFTVGTAPPNPTGSLSRTQQERENLAQSVASAVLQDVQARSRVPASALRIVKAEPQTWPDACLGLQDTGDSCTRARVPGWQVVVANGQQRWVYRTNASGSVVKLHEGKVTPKNAPQMVSFLS